MEVETFSKDRNKEISFDTFAQKTVDVFFYFIFFL